MTACVQGCMLQRQNTEKPKQSSPEPPLEAAPERRRHEARERRREPERRRRAGRAPRAVEEARVDVARVVLAVDAVVVRDLADALEAGPFIKGDGRFIVSDDVEVDAAAARLRLRGSGLRVRDGPSSGKVLCAKSARPGRGSLGQGAGPHKLAARPRRATARLRVDLPKSSTRSPAVRSVLVSNPQ